MAKLFEGARQNKKFVAKFILFALIFWLLQFSFQYYFAVPNEPESSLFKGAGNLLQTSLVRSLAFSGATFFAIALLLSSFFRWKPNYAKYWHVRRSLGVMLHSKLRDRKKSGESINFGNETASIKFGWF